MKYYAVIDTNVLVSSLLSPHPDSATVLIRKHVAKGDLVPLFNAEIFAEYRSVLARPKLGLPESLVAAVLDAINEAGLSLGRTASAESTSLSYAYTGNRRNAYSYDPTGEELLS